MIMATTEIGDTLERVPMTLDEIFQNGAAYLAYKTRKKLEPQGTVFFIQYRHGTGDCVYAVTAAHCVVGARQY